MHSVKEKLSNIGSAAKEKVDIHKAKVEEKVEKAEARTKEEKVIAEERRKAKEAEAKMELHDAKARHATEKLTDKLHSHTHHEPPLVGTHGHGHHEHHQPVTDPPLYGSNVPAYTPGGQSAQPKWL